MSLTVELPADLEAELQQAALRQAKNVQEIVQDSISQQLRQDILPEAESTPLQMINTPFAVDARQRRDVLLLTQTERPLTVAEQSELVEVIDAVELANAWR
jgi:hypothetical protein